MKRPDIKDGVVLRYVEHLEKELEDIRSSPVLSTYMAVRSQIESWNEQLEVGADGQNFINLAGDKDVKVFDRAFKYFSEMVTLHKQLEELRKMMTPEELAETKKIKQTGGGIAESLAQNNGKG